MLRGAEKTAAVQYTNRMNEPWAIINGEWVSASQAAVSVADAGFVLGATASEQVRTFRGRLFRWDEHLARLEQSLNVMGLDLPMSRKDLTLAASELVERNAKLLDRDDDLGLSTFVTPDSMRPLPPASNRDRRWACTRIRSPTPIGSHSTIKAPIWRRSIFNRSLTSVGRLR